MRQFVARECGEGAQITVGQRLKRGPQIVMKLSRHPTMKLSRMQDIAGCRAILLGGADSIETIKRTHGQYFEDNVDAVASPFLAGV